TTLFRSDLIHHFGRLYAPYSGHDRARPYDTDELLALVGLTEYADQRIKTLSGGQRRRLDVAIGIVGRPELLFLDEPTAGIDPKARTDVHDLITRLAAAADTPNHAATHDLTDAEDIDDPARHIAELYAEHGDEITDLQVTRASLEDVYMAMVQRHESGDTEYTATEFDKENR